MVAEVSNKIDVKMPNGRKPRSECRSEVEDMKEGTHGFQGGTILPLCQRILIPPLMKSIIEDSQLASEFEQKIREANALSGTITA